MNKALAIIHHFGSGVTDFVIRANGELNWDGPGEEPTNEELELWDSERLLGIDAVQYKIDRVNGTDANPIKYLSFGDAEDLRYWDNANNTNKLQEHNDAVRLAHEKPD